MLFAEPEAATAGHQCCCFALLSLVADAFLFIIAMIIDLADVLTQGLRSFARSLGHCVHTAVPVAQLSTHRSYNNTHNHICNPPCTKKQPKLNLTMSVLMTATNVEREINI